jgi:Protein of unknown function (DUF2442)
MSIKPPSRECDRRRTALYNVRATSLALSWGECQLHAQHSEDPAKIKGNRQSRAEIAEKRPALSSIPERSNIVAMRSTPTLLEARPLDGYVVHVRFEDGTTADIDLSYLLDYGGVFEPLRDSAYFAQLRADAEAGTIVWPNNADIAPETLYASAQSRAATTA